MHLVIVHKVFRAEGKLPGVVGRKAQRLRCQQQHDQSVIPAHIPGREGLVIHMPPVHGQRLAVAQRNQLGEHLIKSQKIRRRVPILFPTGGDQVQLPGRGNLSRLVGGGVLLRFIGRLGGGLRSLGLGGIWIL